MARPQPAAAQAPASRHHRVFDGESRMQPWSLPLTRRPARCRRWSPKVLRTTDDETGDEAAERQGDSDTQNERNDHPGPAGWTMCRSGGVTRDERADGRRERMRRLGRGRDLAVGPGRRPPPVDGAVVVPAVVDRRDTGLGTHPHPTLGRGGPMMGAGGGSVMRVRGSTSRTGNCRPGRAQTRRGARRGQPWHQDQRRHDHAGNVASPHAHVSHHIAMRTMVQLALARAPRASRDGPTSSQIHRHECIGVARVEPPVGQGGIGPHDAGKYLGARAHRELVG